MLAIAIPISYMSCTLLLWVQPGPLRSSSPTPWNLPTGTYLEIGSSWMCAQPVVSSGPVMGGRDL